MVCAIHGCCTLLFNCNCARDSGYFTGYLSERVVICLRASTRPSFAEPKSTAGNKKNGERNTAVEEFTVTTKQVYCISVGFAIIATCVPK